MSAAMLAEANDIIRENWGYDFRLYIAMETPKGEEITTDMLPAVHRAFNRAQGAGAYSNLAETLCVNNYEKALPDIYKKLEGEEDVMKIQFLLAALKRMPRESHKEKTERFLAHSNELVRLRAKEVMESVAAAAAEGAK